MKKRIMSSVITLIVVISMVITPAGAITTGEDTAERSRLSREEVKGLVTEAFPEYREKLQKKTIGAIEGRSMLASTEQPVLVYQETRKINEFDSVTYQEYSNGAVLATATLLAPTGQRTETSNNEYNGFTYVTLNMYTYCTYATNMIYIEGVEIRYRAGAYGEILSNGTPAPSSLAGYAPATLMLASETGTDTVPGYLRYEGRLDCDGSFSEPGVVQLNTYLQLTIKSSGYSVSAGWA